MNKGVGSKISLFFPVVLLIIVFYGLTLLVEESLVFFIKNHGSIFLKPGIVKERYSILPSIATILWIGIFIIITILTLSLFSALYLYFFVSNDSRYKKFFIRFLEFYQFMPEVLLIGIGYTTFGLLLNLNINSILIISLNFFLIIFPLIVNIVFRSLNLLRNNLRQDLYIAESKIKYLISNILPVISTYIAYHIMKIIVWMTNFGFIMLFLVGSDFSFKIPKGFSGHGSFLISDFLISVIHKTQNIGLSSTILLSLLAVNILLYLVAFLIKRFTSFDFN